MGIQTSFFFLLKKQRCCIARYTPLKNWPCVISCPSGGVGKYGYTDVKRTCNVHKMFIYNIGIPKHEKHLRLLSSGTKLFYYLWVKRFFDIRREAQSFYADFSIWPPTIMCSARSAQIRLASPRSQSQLTDFSQISAHTSGAWRHSHPCSHTLSGIFIVTYLNDTPVSRAREHLRSCLHLTNPCTEPKGSQPN